MQISLCVKRVFFILLFLIPSCIWSLTGEEKFEYKIDYNTIIKPLPTSPQIVEREKEIEVEYKGKENIKDFKIFLNDRYGNRIQLSISSIKYENEIYKIKAKIPNKIPTLLYDLLVISSEKEAISKRAVMVIDKFPDKFYFIHLTDIHIPTKGGGYHPAKEYLPFWTSDKILPKLIEEINLINPAFVLITGDCVASSEDISRILKLFHLPVSEYSKSKIAQIVENEYKEFLDFIDRFQVPTYVVPGNHDITGTINEISLSMWEKLIGKRYFSFNFGNYYFAGLDNSNMMEAISIVYPNIDISKVDFDEEQILWLKEDLEKNKNKKMKVFFFHIPVEKLTTNIKPLIKDYNISLILAGHMHRDKVAELPRGSGRLWVETKSVLDFGGYRLIKIDDGKIISHSQKGTKDASYHPFNLNVTYHHERNKITAVVENKWDETFENAILKFEIPKNKKYKITGGRQKEKLAQKNKEILFVEFEAKPKDKTLVTVEY